MKLDPDPNAFVPLASASSMTMREQFAGMIVQGLMANPEVLKRYQGYNYLEFAVREADKLIAQLALPPHPETL